MNEEDNQNKGNSYPALEVVNDIVNGLNPFIDVEDVDDLFEDLMHHDDVDKAEILTRYAMNLYPNSTDIMLLRANLLTDLDRFNEAEQMLNYLLQIEKEDAEIFISYGWMRLRQFKINEAIKHFDRAIQIADQFDDQHYLAYEIGLNLNEFEFPDKAEKYLRQFHQIHPDDLDGIAELAYCLERLEKDEESMTLYQKLVDLDPFSELGWYNLGLLYGRNNEPAKAIEAYETAVAINQNYPEAVFNLANLYMSESNIERAHYYYTEYVSITTAETREDIVFQYLGECWEEFGNWDLAYRFFILSTCLTPENAGSWYGLAMTELINFDNEMCIMAVSRAIKLDSTVGAYYFIEAQAYMNMERYDDMLKTLLEGLKYDNNDIIAWLQVLETVSANNKHFDYKNFIDQMHQAYGESLALNLVEAYILFLYDKNDSRIEELLSTVALNYPIIIYEARCDTKIKRFLLNKQIYPILQKFNITIK